MAKFVTKSVYTFTDELTGESVEQNEEPTTFKIKLVGDSNTYEKIMSQENEERFAAWLKSDGAALAGDYEGQIEELQRKIEELQSAPAKSAPKTRRSRTEREGSAKAVLQKHLPEITNNEVKEAAREAGLTVEAKGVPKAEAWMAAAKKMLSDEQFSEIKQ